MIYYIIVFRHHKGKFRELSVFDQYLLYTWKRITILRNQLKLA